MDSLFFLQDSSRYVPTGNTISRQVVGTAVVPVVTEYCDHFATGDKGNHYESVKGVFKGQKPLTRLQAEIS